MGFGMPCQEQTLVAVEIRAASSDGGSPGPSLLSLVCRGHQVKAAVESWVPHGGREGGTQGSCRPRPGGCGEGDPNTHKYSVCKQRLKWGVRGQAKEGQSPALDSHTCLLWATQGTKGLGDETEAREAVQGAPEAAPPGGNVSRAWRRLGLKRAQLDAQCPACSPSLSRQHAEEVRVNAEQTPLQPPPNYL